MVRMRTLFGRKPEREIAGVMLDQKSDKAFMCAQRRAMDADWDFVDNEWIAMVQRLAPFNFGLQFAETAEQDNASRRFLASIP